MKQSDIFTLILIAGIGTLAAFFVCQTLLGDPDSASVRFKTVNRVVSSELAAPDLEVFNSTSINPTVEVYVGGCEDIDQNGILDEMELASCQPEELEEKSCIDANGDGVLDMDELKVCGVDLETKAYEECDADESGALDEAEMAVCKIKLEEQQEEPEE